jgi:archaellum component FlaC
MLNLRLEGITAAQNEVSARIALLDKQMSMVTRDVRDLRGGVTRQLVAQDERLSKMESQLGSIQVMLQEVVRRLPGG